MYCWLAELNADRNHWKYHRSGNVFASEVHNVILIIKSRPKKKKKMGENDGEEEDGPGRMSNIFLLILFNVILNNKN